MIKKCQQCGKEYETDKYWIRFCSYECYQAFRDSKEDEMRVCEICGEEYHPVRGNQKYCCQECRETARKLKDKQYYQDHKEEIKKNAKRWSEDHRDKRNRIARNYYQRHRREVLDKFKAKRMADHKSALAKEQAYRDSHREERRAQGRAYWNRKKIKACKAEHDNCFSCPTEDGECLYD